MHRPLAVLIVGVLAAGATALLSGSSRVLIGAAAGPLDTTGLDPAHPAPVLVELFTSEGCSSCPPADAMLARLVDTQPVPGVHVIGLGEHVDYWDRLGWRDAFSSPAFSARQSDYARSLFRPDSIYTPQMVVGGRDEFVGSDERRALDAVARAGQRGRATAAAVVLTPDATGSVRIDVTGVPGKADIVVALTQSDLVTQVRGGENGGRRLTHSSVVRSMQRVAVLGGRAHDWSGTYAPPLSPDWPRGPIRVVAFAQDPASRHILAAADRLLDVR